MPDRPLLRALTFLSLTSIAATAATTAAAQGQPADSPAASTALPPAPPPPAGYAPPPSQPQQGWTTPPPNYGPPPPPPPEEKKGAHRNVSITFSPLHLILPVFEATVEVRAHDHVGIALIGGYGQVKVSDVFSSYKFSVYEVGGQVLFYPISTFDKGLQLGAEALYVKVNTDDNYRGNVTVSGAGSGLAVGPLVGYKFCTSGGFSFVVQGGVQFMTVKAKASD